MRKKITAAILLCVAVVTMILCAFSSSLADWIFNSNMILDEVSILSQEEWDTIISVRDESSMNRDFLTYNGGVPAYDSSVNTFYLPQDLDSSSWEGTLSSKEDGARLVVLENDLLHDRSTALQDGTSFSCLYYTDTEYSEFFIVFTGVSTVCIDYNPYEELTEEKEDHDGFVMVQGTDGSYVSSDCIFHVRGAVSAYDDKKSFKVNLRTEEGENNDLSLLGMRSDDDWILNSQYRDGSRIREPLCYEVWYEMQELVGVKSPFTSSTEFVEVFLNTQYMGLYALQEPEDGKTFDLEEDDILYKVLTWEKDEWGEQGITQYNGEESIEGARIVWPKDSSLLKWDVMENLYLFNEEYISWEELNERGVTIDTDELTLFSLFIQFVRAADSTWKNVYFACEMQQDGTYEVKLYPWDLNSSFGDDYEGEFNMEKAEKIVDEDGNPTSVAKPWKAYLENCPDEAWEQVCVTWKTLRDAGFSAEYVCQNATDLWAEVLSSGAIFREAEKWPGTIDGNDYTNMITWIETRFAAMDQYYEYSAEQ